MSGAASSLTRTCVLFALPEEAAPFLRRLAVSPELRRKCIVTVSGVGAEKAERAVKEWQASSQGGRLIVCGFGGGLTEAAPSGSLLLAERVLDATGSGATLTAYRPDAAMRAAAGEALGDLVTVPRVLITPDEKRALNMRTGAVMADMETAGAVRAAERAGTRWMAVRVATDSVDEPLPFDFNDYADSNGNPDRRRIAAATLAQPWKIPALLRLGRRSSFAAGLISQFLETYLMQLMD